MLVFFLELAHTSTAAYNRKECNKEITLLGVPAVQPTFCRRFLVWYTPIMGTALCASSSGQITRLNVTVNTAVTVVTQKKNHFMSSLSFSSVFEHWKIKHGFNFVILRKNLNRATSVKSRLCVAEKQRAVPMLNKPTWALVSPQWALFHSLSVAYSLFDPAELSKHGCEASRSLFG